ncbi:MAG: matrixin family metalloprotease [Ferruginibacter sp.]
MIPRHFYFLFILLFFCSCKNKEAVNPFAKNNIVIDIQPFNGISDVQVQYVFKEIKKVYPYIEIQKAIALPQLAWYAPRNRYRADSLIHFLSRQTIKGHVTIGLTNKDISTTKNTIVDFGIMGLGFRPGNACVASSFRLSKTETNMQLFKLAIHELGHTQGLAHCPVSTCFMRDAEGRNPTNEEKEFCKKCKTYLIRKGWKLN